MTRFGDAADPIVAMLIAAAGGAAVASTTAQPSSADVGLVVRQVGLAPQANPTDAIANSSNITRIMASLMGFDGTNWQRQRLANAFKPQDAVAVGTEATIWTPAAGKKFRLMGGVLAVATAAGAVKLRDNTAGTIIAVIPTLTLNDPVPFELDQGILSAVANNVLTAQGAATAVLHGIVFGTEE